MTLTLQQRNTLAIIQDFVEKHQYAPTASEIAQALNIQSRGVVYRYLKALENAGCIALEPGKKRNIRLLTSDKHIPLVGTIAAGQPIEAIQTHESIDLVDMLAGPKRFALRVKGDSMVDEGILDGDVVICESCSNADNGAIVVALIDQQEATLKRLHYKAGEPTITLIPANVSHKAQEYPKERVQIQGVLVGLLRLSNKRISR